jgi:hypothetical protein
MHRTSILRQTWLAAAVAATALAFGASVAGAQDIPKCQRAVVKNAQKYASKRMKALQKCEEGRLTGKITTTCALDAKTQDKINKAATKLAEGVAKACTGVTVSELNLDGKVNRCVGGDLDGNRCVDDQDCIGGVNGVCTPTDECPTFLNGRLPGDDTCEIPLASTADVAECLECATAAKVDSVISTFYATLNAASEDKDVLKCQKDIGKRTAKYFDKVEKALAKCQDALINGKVMSCPDSKANDKIAKALTKLNEAIAKTCTDGAVISAATGASKIWGQASRYGACPVDGTQSAAGLAGALSCLAENAAACDVSLSIGDTACSTDLCGNGQIDDGETCDDGNTTQDIGVGGDDVCPADCNAAPCAVSGTQSVTVNITTPEPIISALVLVGYNDTDVNIGGIGNDPPVLAAVTSGVFATSPRDTDTALRIGLEDPFFTGVGSGAAATVTFNVCSAATVTAADFGCMVVDAGNTAFQSISGVTCNVTVP